MAGNKVQQNLDAALVAFVYEGHEVGVGTETLVHLVVVQDVVASVDPTGFEQRVEPYDIHSQTLYVVKFGKHTGDVADAITVRILERGRIDLINDRILQPLRSLMPGLFERTRFRLRKYRENKQERQGCRQ